MTDDQPELSRRIAGQVQGALALDLAYIGIAAGLLGALARLGNAGPEELARAAGQDPAYVRRWCDAAYAFELLEEVRPGVFRLTETGGAFCPDAPGTLMPFAVQHMISAHMAERAAGLMRTGERPGEQVLAERESILPWFGPMLEHHFGPLLEEEILPRMPAFEEVDRRGGLAVDLGCGNGWYLRRLLQRYPNIRGLGVDGFEENIRQAREIAAQLGLSARLRFETGDMHDFAPREPADLIAMNRALHHVWAEGERVFAILRAHLKPGGLAVMWEPNWPAERGALRNGPRRAMAFQNLAEHVQGNRFLQAEEIAERLEASGLEPEIHLFAEGREAVIVGRKA